jgi:hypothetical protein
MRFVHLFARLRRGAAFAVLGVALTTLALSLSQCQMVGERIAGISLSKANPGQCISNCAHTYNDSVRVESEFHVSKVHSCASDSVCLALEEMRHEAEMNRLQLGRAACQAKCHHQGSGGGGR